MKKHILFFCLLSIFTNTFAQKRISICEGVNLTKVADSYYIHTTSHTFEGYGTFTANGLIFIKNKKAIMIDSPWDDDQTKVIVNYLRDSLQTELTTFVGCHYHNDCIGGMNYLNKIGVETYTTAFTKELCEKYRMPIAKNTFKDKTVLNFEGEKVVCQFLGGGHTADNIVVYFPKDKILFGGCLIKTLGARNLGNTKEANIDEWNKTVAKVKDSFKDVRIVIPGHGKYGDASLFNHTINLVEKHRLTVIF